MGGNFHVRGKHGFEGRLLHEICAFVPKNKVVNFKTDSQSRSGDGLGVVRSFDCLYTPKRCIFANLQKIYTY